MSKVENWDKAMTIMARFSSSMSGLALSYLATKEKIAEITLKPIYSESLSKRENIDRMIVVGVSAYQIIYFLNESSIMALAKVIEDTSIDLKLKAGFKFHVVNTNHNVIYIREH